MNTQKQALTAQPTMQHTAEFFGVDISTVRRWVAAGKLGAYRVGTRLIRVDRDSVLALASPIGGAA
jgi:excisionase family DNA binding protein